MIDLEKKAEQIGILLDKKGIRQPPVLRVGIALDISGSMSSIISRGDLQKAFNQMMGVAVKFDDNGELDVFKFDTSCEYVGTSTPKPGDFDSYIVDNNIRPRGGTSYAPIVKEAVKFFFSGGGITSFFSKNKDQDVPVLMLIITDGEPGDARETAQAMQAAEDKPIYFHMVGVGGGGKSSFPTISKLADDLPNVGEVYLKGFDLPDSEVYDQLICDELIEFLAKHTKPVFGRARG